jgi:hypothetical protein
VQQEGATSERAVQNLPTAGGEGRDFTTKPREHGVRSRFAGEARGMLYFKAHDSVNSFNEMAVQHAAR